MGSFGAKHQPGGRSDAQLLADHVAGDPFAFEELFHRYQHHLYRVARLTSRDHHDAADALQDALLKAHRCAPEFRHDCAVSSWLHRIVVNSCVDRLRRNKIHETDQINDTNCLVRDPAPRVENSLLIERALLTLPDEQRVAVVAVDMQGFSVSETAALLGIPEGTVKSRCARARAKLALALSPLDHAADA